MTTSSLPAGLKFLPLTPKRWPDFEKLFGARGACGGCWCMWWRTKRSDWERLKGEGNRKAMKSLVESGTVPGILAYAGKEAVGWCSVAPRGDFEVLENSRILKPVDDRPVWSVVCFFIAKEWRNRGMSVHLLEAAAAYARKKGARILEGYPVEPKKKPMPAAFAYTGLAAGFRKAGFFECARRSETRPIMRLETPSRVNLK